MIRPAARAEGGRLREFQAILPLRGKIINAYKSREDKVLANEEVRSMISAVGTGIGEDQDLTKRRYGRIVIMTDADVDGSHIRTLLLTFFYRQMYDLVAAGHVYVAQPPLFRVRSKSNTYYVQTEEEMRGQLLELGLSNSALDARRRPTRRRRADDHARPHAGRPRRIDHRARAPRHRPQDPRRTAGPVTGKLPVYHVFVDGREEWFVTREALDAFVAEEEAAAGGKLNVDSGMVGSASAAAPSANGDATTEATKLRIVELHEVRTLNTLLADLEKSGFNIEALIPQERTGEETSRYMLRRGENEIGLEDLRGLPGAIRAAGEKGLTITRFKGLGEMNAEELRDTTLDPKARTLMQIRMDDVGSADDLFRVLMGDQVEPRREFIQKHALDVRNLDV